jgi:glycosyltransferase involved in cell wall biosynthesis
MSASDAELHVAAMPFPTRQGTQAVVRAMLTARTEAGRTPHLITYGEGEGHERMPFAWHRAPAPGQSVQFRSGPSLRKALLDASLTASVKRVHDRLHPRVVIAHHVEAALACLAARALPLVFFAHTDLGEELPSSGPTGAATLLRPLGRALDGALCARASAVAAISPALRDALAEATGQSVTYVPTPWPVPPAFSPNERDAARARLGLDAGDEVALYAGNLDAYQGWEDLIAALAKLTSRPTLVVATASEPTRLHQVAARAGVGPHVRVVELPADEAGRRALYAAVDVAVVTRRARGGLPVKLLDALSRGVPTVVVKRAAAGLPLDQAALLVDNDDGDALAGGLRIALGAPRASRELAARGQDYIRRAHASRRFDDVLEDLCAAAASR